MKKREIGQGIPLSKIAKHLGLAAPEDGERLIVGLSPYQPPQSNCIAFINDDSARRVIKGLEGSPLAALIVDESIPLSELPQGISYLTSKDPMRSFIDLVPLFFEPYPQSKSISKFASVDPSATIGSGVTISDFVSIGAGCTIEDDVTIYPQVTIYPEVTVGKGSTIHAGAVIRERCRIGEGVIIQNGAVIGSDGFGYLPDEKEGIRAVPQVGIVELGKKVEIGANTCIDRGAFGDTTIGNATKLDNLIQVGHNVKIGNYSIICAHVAVAGSSEIGNQVTIGGNTAVAGRIKIHDNVRIAGQSAATSSLKEKGDYAGFPAIPAMEWRRQFAALQKLPELLKQLRKANARDSTDNSEE